MGWASYLEDVLGRLSDDLRQLSGRLEVSGWSPSREAEAASLLKRCEELVMNVRVGWDLATDPNLDMAHELVVARRQRDASEAARQRADASITKLRSELSEADHRRSRAERQVKEALETARLAEEKYAELLELDSGRLYNKYPPPDLGAKRAPGRRSSPR